MGSKPSFEITGREGNTYTCRIIDEINNENGHMLYVFRTEQSGQDFTITKDLDGWKCLHGELPDADCLGNIGKWIDSSNS